MIETDFQYAPTIDIEEFLERNRIDPNEVVMYHFTNNEMGETIYLEEILLEFAKYLKHSQNEF